jgi:hypothetical protein
MVVENMAVKMINEVRVVLSVPDGTDFCRVDFPGIDSVYGKKPRLSFFGIGGKLMSCRELTEQEIILLQLEINKARDNSDKLKISTEDSVKIGEEVAQEYKEAVEKTKETADLLNKEAEIRTGRIKENIQNSNSKVFNIISSERSEYPGDGLYLLDPVDPRTHNDLKHSKSFMDNMGIKLKQGDEVEITVRIISRIETKRVYFEPK